MVHFNIAMTLNNTDNVTNCDLFIITVHSKAFNTVQAFLQFFCLACSPTIKQSTQGRGMVFVAQTLMLILQSAPMKKFLSCFLSQEYVFYSKVKQNIAIGYTHQVFV